MFYYGYYTRIRIKQTLRTYFNNKIFLKNRCKRAVFKNTSQKPVNLNLYLAKTWKTILFKEKHLNSTLYVLYAFSPTYFFKFAFSNNTFLFFDPKAMVLRLKYWLYYNHLFYYSKLISFVVKVFLKPLFLRIRFKGKGYYIYKNKRSTITPQMGYAHRIYVYAFSIIVKFLAKTKIFLFGLSKNDILKIGHAIKKIRPINVFTGRGIRFRKQIIYRKVGKVSSYR